MNNVDFQPGYIVRTLDKGWGVYLVVDLKNANKSLVATDSTWIATFKTKELADQYIDLLFKE